VVKIAPEDAANTGTAQNNDATSGANINTSLKFRFK
jgi:hypothetical protein